LLYDAKIKNKRKTSSFSIDREELHAIDCVWEIDAVYARESEAV